MNGADLSRCSVGGADFTLAKWDATTRFPQGFDPESIEFLAARPRNTAGCCGYDGMSIQPTEPTGEQDLPSL